MRYTTQDAYDLGIKEPSPEYKIGGYGSGQVLPCGITEVSVTVDQARARVPIYVVSSEVKAIPLLVGQPFTEQPHATIVRRRNTLRIFEEHGSFANGDEKLRYVQVPDLPHVPQRYGPMSLVTSLDYVGIVRLTTNESATGRVFVDAQFRIQEYKEHCLPACVIDVAEGGNSVLPILNVSKSDLNISKGDVAASGSWCSEMPETASKRSRQRTYEQDRR